MLLYTYSSGQHLISRMNDLSVATAGVSIELIMFRRVLQREYKLKMEKHFFLEFKGEKNNE